MKKIITYFCVLTFAFSQTVLAGKPVHVGGNPPQPEIPVAAFAKKTPGPDSDITTNAVSNPLSPAASSILLSTRVGERVTNFFKNYRPQFFNKYRPQLTDSMKFLIDTFDVSYAISNPSRFNELAAIIATELDGGFKNVWNQPIEGLRVHGGAMDGALGEFIGDLVVVSSRDEIDDVTKLAHEGLTVEFALAGQELDAFEAQLKAATKGSLVSHQAIEELVDLIRDAYPDAQGAYEELIDDLALAAKNDPLFWIPEIGDEVLVGFTIGSGGDILEFFNNYRPQFSEAQKKAFDPPITAMVQAVREAFYRPFFDIWTELSVIMKATGNEVAMEELTLVVSGSLRTFFGGVRRDFEAAARALAAAEDKKDVAQAIAIFGHKVTDLLAAFKVEISGNGIVLCDNTDPAAQKACRSFLKQLGDIMGEVTQIFTDGFESGANVFEPEARKRPGRAKFIATLQDIIGNSLEFFNKYRPQFSENQSRVFDGVAQTLIGQASEAFDSFFDVWTEISIIYGSDDRKELQQFSRQLGITLWDYERLVIEEFRGLIESLRDAKNPADFNQALLIFTDGFDDGVESFKFEVKGLLDRLLASAGKPSAELQTAAKAMLERVDAINLTFQKGAEDATLSLTALDAYEQEVELIGDVFFDFEKNFKGTDEELQAILEGGRALNEEYFAAFMIELEKVRVSSLAFKTVAEFEAAVADAESRLALALQEWADKAIIFYNGHSAKAHPDDVILIGNALASVKGAMVNINLIGSSGIHDFFETWAACISPLCGGW